MGLVSSRPVKFIRQCFAYLRRSQKRSTRYNLNCYSFRLSKLNASFRNSLVVKIIKASIAQVTMATVLDCVS